MKVLDFVKNIDLFGRPISFLNSDSSGKFKNSFGGILTIIVFLLGLAAGIYFFILFINRKDANINFSTNKQDDVYIKDFHEYPLMFRMTLNSNKLFDEPSKNYKVFPMLRTYDIQKNPSSTTVLLEAEPCSLDKHLKKFKSVFDKEEVYKFYCINYPESFDFKGAYGTSFYYQTLNIRFRPCLKLIDGDECVDEELLLNQLQQAYIDIKSLSYSINSSNKVAGQPEIHSSRYPTSSTVHNRIVYYFKVISYISDFGFIFEDLIEETLSQPSGVDVAIDLRNLNDPTNKITYKSFIELYIALRNNKDLYYRSYMKAQTLLANIGGIIRGLMLCCEIILFPIYSKFYEISLTQNLNSTFEEFLCNKADNFKCSFIEKNCSNDEKVKNDVLNKASNSGLNKNFNLKELNSNNKENLKESNFESENKQINQSNILMLKDNFKSINEIESKKLQDSLSNNNLFRQLKSNDENLKSKIEKVNSHDFKLISQSFDYDELNLNIFQLYFPIFCFCNNRKKNLYLKKMEFLKEKLSIKEFMNDKLKLKILYSKIFDNDYKKIINKYSNIVNSKLESQELTQMIKAYFN